MAEGREPTDVNDVTVHGFAMLMDAFRSWIVNTLVPFKAPYFIVWCRAGSTVQDWLFHELAPPALLFSSFWFRGFDARENATAFIAQFPVQFTPFGLNPCFSS